MITAAMGPPPGKANGALQGALQGAVGGQSEQAKTAVAELCYPTIGSVKAAVLADLLRGDRISHLDVWQRHGSSRAAHHVLRLRRSGWPVITKEIDAPTSDGRVARIAEYSLSPETIDTAGEIGQRYIANVRAARRES